MAALTKRLSDHALATVGLKDSLEETVASLRDKLTRKEQDLTDLRREYTEKLTLSTDRIRDLEVTRTNDADEILTLTRELNAEKILSEDKDKASEIRVAKDSETILDLRKQLLEFKTTSEQQLSLARGQSDQYFTELNDRSHQDKERISALQARLEVSSARVADLEGVLSAREGDLAAVQREYQGLKGTTDQLAAAIRSETQQQMQSLQEELQVRTASEAKEKQVRPCATVPLYAHLQLHATHQTFYTLIHPQTPSLTLLHIIDWTTTTTPPTTTTITPPTQNQHHPGTGYRYGSYRQARSAITGQNS